MPILTRRRYLDRPNCWHVFYDDVHVGTINQRVGVPIAVDQWGWSCGFYPGLHPGQHRYGTAASFAEARDGFETDWQALLPEIPDGAFEEYRHDRESRAQMRASARGDRLPSEVFSSIMRCVCGVQFNSWKPDESFDHRVHIYAAEQNGIRW